MRQKHRTSNLNIGASSLLLILVVLCLVSFAALSLSSADADAKLTEKAAAHTQAYYTACCTAQDMLAALDAQLLEAYRSADNEQAYFDFLAAGTFAFTLPVTQTQKLYVSAEPLYPSGKGDPFYRITRWQVVADAGEEPGTALPILK